MDRVDLILASIPVFQVWRKRDEKSAFASSVERQTSRAVVRLSNGHGLKMNELKVMIWLYAMNITRMQEISLNRTFLVCRTPRTQLYLWNSSLFLMSRGWQVILLSCSVLTCPVFSRNENQVWPRRGPHGSREPASSELPQRLPRLPGFQSIRLRTIQL